MKRVSAHREAIATRVPLIAGLPLLLWFAIAGLPGTAAAQTIFADSFESGGNCNWSFGTEALAPTLQLGTTQGELVLGSLGEAPSCSAGTTAGVIFEWQPLSTQRLALRLTSSVPADLALAVVDGCFGGAEIVCRNTSGVGGAEVASLELSASEPIYVLATGATAEAAGGFALTASTCGDGVVASPELCDGGDLAGRGCSALGFAGGTLACTPSCTYDTALCTSECTAESCKEGCCVNGACVQGVDCDTCSAYGLACATGTDCCSANCVDGFCQVPAQACLLVGSECGVNADCCSGSCDPNIDGVARCSAPNQCQSLGSACQKASDCCSLFCDDLFECSEQDVCAPEGALCSTDRECCTDACVEGQCVGGSCRVLGDACTAASECCSKLCLDGQCSFQSHCAAEEELCSSDLDCCSGTCDAESGRCASLGLCSTADEPCAATGQCCTNVCAAGGTPGVFTCEPAGGCRPQGETCGADLDCCSGLCEEELGSGARRCANLPGCVPAGEVCGEGASNNCCDGGSGACVETVLDVSRCTGNLGPGCWTDGTPCSLPEECCGNACVRSGNSPTGYACASTCIPGGQGLCTRDADCCPGAVCQGSICQPGGPYCAPAGGRCELHSDCCSGDCNTVELLLAGRFCG